MAVRRYQGGRSQVRARLYSMYKWYELSPLRVLGGCVELDTVTVLNPGDTQFEDYLPQLIDIYESAYRDLPLYADQGHAKVHDYLRWLRESDIGGFFVALDNGTPVGFACLHSERRGWHGDPIGELHEVVVKPGCQGHGIGRELIARAIQYADDRGRERVRLWVGDKNERAATIYRRLGFVTLSRHGVWERMELVLTRSQ